MEAALGLLPIYALLTLGYVVGRARRADATRCVQITTLVLLFSVGVEASPALRVGAARLLGVSAALGLTTGLASAALAWAISGRSRPLRLPRVSRGTLAGNLPALHRPRERRRAPGDHHASS